jgi:hypothetical protein
MNRKLASALAVTGTFAIATASALTLVVTRSAYADDITIEATPFVSTRSQAEVQAEVTGQAERLRIASSEEAMQQNDVYRVKSSYTAEQARSDYLAQRAAPVAMTGEDSGSVQLAKARSGASASPGVAPPAR